MNGPIWQAFSQVLGDPEVLLIVVIAAAYGTFMGAVPGLTATMAVALLVPVTYFMGPIPTMAAIVTLAVCAIFAGDIPCALVRIPGTPASAAYADDAYSLTRKGQQNKVLGVSLSVSVVGGLIGAAVLILFAHRLAKIALLFSRYEYFWLYMLGLSCAVVITRGAVLRGLLGLLIGLLLSTVGLSAVHSEARFTFGRAELFQGINFIPAMIGLFGVSEVLRHALTVRSKGAKDARESLPGGRKSTKVPIILAAFGLMIRRKLSFLRSGLIGSVVGMLPGAGADIASWVSLAVSKRLAKTKGTDEEKLKGICDAAAANNSALAGAWVPALVLGIPGDSITAIVLGVLMMKNVKPGPEIFEKQGTLVYSIYLLFILASLVLLPVGYLAIKAGSHIVRIPRKVLLPIILLFCTIGAYAINGSYFDVWVMLAMGLLGFELDRRSVPLGPVVLAIILGGSLEERFIQGMTGADGRILEFVSRPVAAVLALICVLLWLSPLVAWVVRAYRRGGARPQPGD